MIEASNLGSLADLPTALLDAPARQGPPGAGELTNAMLITWYSRPDLHRKFELSSADGRNRFRRWCLSAMGRHGRQTRLLRTSWRFAWRTLLHEGRAGTAGVNLVGYARGVLGMGEHVRMSARAMSAADVPAGIADFTLGLGTRRQSLDTRLPRLRWPRHRCNLFHINADQMPRAYWHLGGEWFGERYNIGYWAWELAKWPAEWTPAIGTVDEIWAPSRFVRDALTPATHKPVQWMPLCVELPPVRQVPRSEIGADDDDYLFVFTLDCHSHFERKNPLAIVRAFRTAFPSTEKAKLIIKGMNADVCADKWRLLVAEAAADSRIRIIDAVWPRYKVLGLVQSCDAYVSLHRSEGFGRGPAEAMLLGKAVIATNYSGTADFCREDNALLVDYSLVAVGPDSYVAAEGQAWADASVECAARQMRALFDDRALGPRLGERGQQTISDEFSSTTIGARYRARLLELGMI
jgi:glycosyltransferase involved in cell wall biosynthesis